MVTGSDCRSEFQTDWALPVYITWVTLSIYVVPIVTLICVYSHICLAVWHSERFNKAVSRVSAASDDDSSAGSSSGHHSGRTHRGGSSRTISAAKLKTVKLTLVVVVSYVVCYGPFFVAQMWAAWDKYAPYEGSISSPVNYYHRAEQRSWARQGLSPSPCIKNS